MSEYKTKEQKVKFYSSYGWKQLSKKIKERDNYECQECKRQGLVFVDDNRLNRKGKKKIQMVTHHIKDLENDAEVAWDEDNLETICVRHHEAEHARYNMKRWEPKVNRFYSDEKW